MNTASAAKSVYKIANIMRMKHWNYRNCHHELLNNDIGIPAAVTKQMLRQNTLSSIVNNIIIQ